MMTHALTIDTTNPQALAAWWSEALGVAIGADHGVLVTLATPARNYSVRAMNIAARNQAFNSVNGDVFCWSWISSQIAAWFGLHGPNASAIYGPQDEAIFAAPP